MGSGENGTIGAPANRAGNAYQEPKSADSSAHAKFADALSQENGNSQVRGGEKKTSTVDNRMTGILNNPHLDENAKVAELRKTIADLPDAEKNALHERLKDRKSHDPLAQQFHYRLSHHSDKAGGTSTTDQVLNALKSPGSKSQAPSAGFEIRGARQRSIAVGNRCKNRGRRCARFHSRPGRNRLETGRTDQRKAHDEAGHHETPSRNDLRFLQEDHQGSGGGHPVSTRQGTGRRNADAGRG